ncbi:hypothetical protein JJL56_02070 [Azospirillum sp. YIM DDC1]|uniref:Uncharacterized protein n=1 Tax=Azospirillum aestuarii TaxID=2802052 RepID=A0ABS1HS40_9PROT|nr:hypothetical protein [Azospirillum aestuarii]MBK4717646.1 hypothetical protein [Azospirillum aestuarii]
MLIPDALFDQAIGECSSELHERLGLRSFLLNRGPASVNMTAFFAKLTA